MKGMRLRVAALTILLILLLASCSITWPRWGQPIEEPAVSQVSAGSFHTCARLSSGQVKCWGYNDDGQLGNPNYDYSNVPVFIVGP